MEPRKLLLINYQSPGDILMMTAAIRDLHRNYPGQYITDVHTSAMQIWENNPFITKLNWKKAKEQNEDTILVKNEKDEIKVIIYRTDKDIEPYYLDHKLIQRSNTSPYHFIHSFVQALEIIIKRPIKLTDFKGDIYLSDKEKSWISQVEEIGYKGPFWIIMSGGKTDFTTKLWDPSRYQEVVNYFKGTIQFVQVGESHGPAMDENGKLTGKHFHPPLDGVIDLRGKTDMRQLIRLVYHSQGIVCPITFLMHAAATVEMKYIPPKNRPCVVVAGGREPAQWEAYPHHQYINRNGTLDCCDNGGCWKSRCQLIGDGDKKDYENVCTKPVDISKDFRIPKCMDMISAEEVINRIKLYFEGGVVSYVKS